jgi:DNA-binding transcriptional ArsR family regulator
LNNDSQKYVKHHHSGEERDLNERPDVLRGVTLRVYRFILKNGNPAGIREIQRALKLSSPTLALYHLNKLEEAGLVKKHMDGYVADRVVLENFIRLKRTLVPRYFFYTVFLAATLVILTTFLRPHTLTREYVFSVAAITVAVITSAYETIRAFSGNTL